MKNICCLCKWWSNNENEKPQSEHTLQQRLPYHLIENENNWKMKKCNFKINFVFSLNTSECNQRKIKMYCYNENDTEAKRLLIFSNAKKVSEWKRATEPKHRTGCVGPKLEIMSSNSIIHSISSNQQQHENKKRNHQATTRKQAKIDKYRNFSYFFK